MYCDTISINKNRGWRGLAQLECIDTITHSKPTIMNKIIFSFSQDMWNDMILRHRIVTETDKYYLIIEFNNTEDRLPKPEQQRSVLIKNVLLKVTSTTAYPKHEWSKANGYDYSALLHYIKNTNNHTNSDWNYVGIRVVPDI